MKKLFFVWLLSSTGFIWTINPRPYAPGWYSPHPINLGCIEREVKLESEIREIRIKISPPRSLLFIGLSLLWQIRGFV